MASNHEPLTLQRIQKVDHYAVSYTDGNSESDTAFISVLEDGRMYFTLPDNGHKKVVQPAGWLKRLITEKLNLGEKGPAEVPDESVPSGVLMGG